jgi:hypothetical protein
VRTTKNIYGDVFEDAAAKIAAKLDAYHGGNAAVNEG